MELHGSLHNGAFASVDTGAMPSVDGEPDVSQGGWSHGHEVGAAAVNPDLRTAFSPEANWTVSPVLPRITNSEGDRAAAGSEPSRWSTTGS